MTTPKPKLVSGGHKGAEAEFGRAAKRWGLEQTTYSFEGHAMEWPVAVQVLSDAELAKGDVSMEIVSQRMGRSYHQAELIRRVIQSIFHMVNASYAVFVIGHILSDDTVKGGTGWAVELARLFNRPVWVFDQERETWFRWRDGRWDPDTPTIGERTFCGTGTRHLGEEGRRAIDELFRRSFGEPTA
jgi:hypothetical protein